MKYRFREMRMVRKADNRKVIDFLRWEIESTDKTLLNVQLVAMKMLFIAYWSTLKIVFMRVRMEVMQVLDYQRIDE